MHRRPRVAVLRALALVVLPAAVAAAPGKPPGPPEAEPALPEVRFEALLPALETSLAAARADTSFDAVTLIEAEETAIVAEELLEEGEAEIAVALLERAIALLPAAPPE
jgi:hypothetical protein